MRWLTGLVVAVVLAGGCGAPEAARGSSAPPPAAAASGASAANPVAAPEPTAQPPLEVRVSHAALSPNVAAVWIAADLGFDREYGLQIDVHQLRTAAMSQAALLAGEIDYAWTGLAPMLGARSGGSDVVFIAATTNRSNAELVVRPPLRTPADLVGKSFGVQSYGGPPHIRTLQALSRLGLDPASATILITGDEGVTTAALLEGVVDGASISYTGATEPKARGFHSWDLAELGVPEITGIVTRPQQLQGQPEATRRLLRALARANAYIHTIDADATARQRVGEAVGARLRQPAEPTLAALDPVRDQLPLDLRVKESDARELQSFAGTVTPAIQELRLEDWLNQTALDDLAREGFFARLQAR
jgi:ABC-type nitrate/sulfonate/bicarbonate transport system substrate-binding protein